MATGNLLMQSKMKSAQLVGGTIKTLLWMLLLCLVASIVLVDYITGDDIWSSIATAFLYYPIITVLPIFLFVKFKPIEKPMTFLRLNKKTDKKIAVKVVLLGVFMATTILSLMFLIAGMFDLASYEGTNYLGSIILPETGAEDDFFSIVMQFILINILSAGIYEEIFFRGFLLNGLRPLGEKKAVALSAVSFGLYHFHPIRGFVTFLASMVWGKVAYMLNNTKYAILLHITYNSVLTIVLMALIFGGIGEYALLLETEMLIGAEIAVFTVSLLVAVKIFRALKKSAKLIENKAKEAESKAEKETENPYWQIDKDKLTIWGEAKEYENMVESAITAEDYLDPVIVEMSAGVKISYAFFVLITLSLTVLSLLAA